MFVTDSLCLSKKICVCHRQPLFVTDSICLSKTVVICHRKAVYVSLTDSLCLSQTVSFVTDSLYLSQTVWVCRIIFFLLCQFYLDCWIACLMCSLFLLHFHQDLSMKFQFVLGLNPIRTDFVDPCTYIKILMTETYLRFFNIEEFYPCCNFSSLWWIFLDIKHTLQNLCMTFMNILAFNFFLSTIWKSSINFPKNEKSLFQQFGLTSWFVTWDQ